MAFAVVNKAWSGYLKLLHKYPVRTQCISTALIMSSGDIFAQKIVERQPKYSPSRTLKFGMIGMCFVGPAFHYWYNFLDRLYTGTKVIRSLKMVATDQCIMAPFIVFSIIGLVGLTKNWSIEEAKTGLKENYIGAMLMNIRVWPPVQFINFTVVPVHLRVLVSARPVHRLSLDHIFYTTSSLAVIMGCGDIISQKIIERQSEWDIVRTAKFGSIGLLFVGPVLHTWYSFVDRFYRGKGAVRTLKMVATDQLVMAPVMIFCIIGLVGFTRHWDVKEAKQSISSSYVGAVLTNYKIWPATQFINFTFVPLHLRLFVVNFVALFWNSYLSYVTRSRAKEDAAISSSPPPPRCAEFPTFR
ncbi:unnamed protein product [Dibothriocephalus latus]|uniref:Mitochondrial inner membrane protein Mpv17 n=1 Tax=Dibothriocephalus latus TaxID=60516 RepID=A0A3P7NQG9_DIBLA|nr:unnamed protein product [Dibothriocephalus latus]